MDDYSIYALQGTSVLLTLMVEKRCLLHLFPPSNKVLLNKTALAESGPSRLKKTKIRTKVSFFHLLTVVLVQKTS